MCSFDFLVLAIICSCCHIRMFWFNVVTKDGKINKINKIKLNNNSKWFNSSIYPNENENSFQLMISIFFLYHPNNFLLRGEGVCGEMKVVGVINWRGLQLSHSRYLCSTCISLLKRVKYLWLIMYNLYGHICVHLLYIYIGRFVANVKFIF